MSMYLLNYVYLKNIPSGVYYKFKKLIITSWQIRAVIVSPMGFPETLTMVSYSAREKRSLLRRLDYGAYLYKVQFS